MTSTLTSTPYKGVRWNTQVDKWVAYVTVNRKEQSLGRFDDKTEAIKARMAGELIYYGKVSTPAPSALYGFKEILNAPDALHYAKAAVSSRIAGAEGVNWNGTCWVSYVVENNELVMIGKFTAFKDAFDYSEITGRKL